MTCPGCGFDQSEGDRCRQCGTPLAAPAAERPGKTAPISEPPPQPPPQTPPRKDKHRARPLHDLDLTIEGMSVDTSVAAAAPAQPPKPRAETAPAPTLVPKPETKPAAAVHPPLPRTTTDAIEGWRIAVVLEVVSGMALVQAERFEHAGPELAKADLAAEPALQEAHALALTRLDGAARALGAKAIVGVRLALTSGPQGLWLCYSGTAVKLDR